MRPLTMMEQIPVLLAGAVPAALVVALALLRAEALGYAGVQLALVVGAPFAFFAGLALHGVAQARLAGRDPRRIPATRPVQA